MRAAAGGGDPSSNTNEDQLKKFIVSSTDDMWKDEGFLLVVNAYLETIRRATEFYSSVDAWVIWANETWLMISYVIKLYKRESGEEESRCSRMLDDQLWFKERGGNVLGEELVKIIRSVYDELEEGKKAYMRVLEETEKAEAKTVGFPAKDELLNHYGAVHEEHIVLLDRSNNLRRQLVKNLRRIKRWKKASTIMFAIGFFTVPVLSALVMIVPVPSAIEVLVGAFSATIGSIGKWCIYLWNKREVAAMFQMIGLDTIQISSYVLLKDMENMQRLIEKMFVEIEFLMLVRKNMRTVAEEPDREVMDKIEEIMIKSDQMFKLAEDHSYKGRSFITHSSCIVSERLSNVTPTTNPKRRSW